ncbi:Usually multiple acids move in and out Transporters 21 [Hibiscus trionum]|uniref:WAT1-related protein n=2 Tax=Hibiscus trionum TaxID=183268 RepID=A0A9W7M5Q0_HIBTR|nr:Usually multiple acids move in and out Transporters 21 [Hibiscus trionum]
MDSKKPYLAIILIQSIYTGMFLLSKAAFDGGMNNFVFVFYRQAAATIFLVPLALFLEWKSLPPLSFVTFCKIFLLSLFGITLSLDVNGVALVYTSATLAAATTNCLPVITFFLALLLGTEALRLKTSAGIAKLTGILICLAGVLTLAFFKGPHFKLFCLHHLFQPHHTDTPTSSGLTWIKGCFLMLISVTFWGLWLVLQGPVLKSYPSMLLFTALQCFLSSIQSFGIAIALVRDPYEWRLGWNVRLVAVAYCGFVVTGVTYYLQSWVVEKKGPVFLAMSTPLNLIFTMLCSAFLLCEYTSLGSVVGGLLLIIGLYSVLWGKTKEQKLLNNHCLDKECTELTVVTA